MTLMPSASRDGLAVNAGAAMPVRVMAVYVRFDADSFAGSSSSGDSTLSMATRLVPLSMLSFRPVMDDELYILLVAGGARVATAGSHGFPALAPRVMGAG